MRRYSAIAARQLKSDSRNQRPPKSASVSRWITSVCSSIMTIELEAEGIGLLRNVLGEKGPRSQIGA